MLKLIFRHISTSQLLAFFLSNVVGLCIVLIGIQVYVDTKPIFTNGDSFTKPEHVVISKEVSSFNTVFAHSFAFTEQELAEIKEQPFVKDVAVFVPSLFNVYASIGSASLGTTIATDMFFEAIPDKFIDINLENWHYNPEDNMVPIIVPRNYLSLYNFGFASSKGLPMMSEKLIKNVIIQFALRGKQDRKVVYGRIVGFSDRINTILVPYDFLLAANAQLNGSEDAAYSRAIIEVNNISDNRINTFLSTKNYKVESGMTDTSKVKSFLLLLLGGVVAFGLLVCALSIYILMLSIFLLIQKMTKHIDNLLLIGYAPSVVAKPYYGIGICLNALSWVVAVGVLLIVRYVYLEKLALLYTCDFPSIGVSLLAGLVLCVVIGIINTVLIRQKINAIWNIHKK